MNNNLRFDDKIREEFSNYTPDVHPRIWENIVARREKRKPVGFWFNLFNSRNIFLLLGLLIAGGTGAWLLVSETNGTSKSRETATRQYAENKSTANTPESQSTINPSNNIDQPATIIPGTTGNAQYKDLSAATEIDPSGKSKKQFSNNSSASIRIFSPSLQDINDGITSGTNKKNKLTPGPLTTSADDNGDEPAVKTEPLVGGSLLGRLIFQAQKLSPDKAGEFELRKRNVPNLLLPDCPSMEKDAAGNKKYIEFYAGPDLGIRKLSDTGNSAYLQKRKESSKFTSGYSAGIRFTKVFNNGMSLRSGINYSQINEKFTFIQGNIVQITYIINANGDTTGSYITTGTRYKTTHNKYRSIDIPLMVGYELGNGKLHVNFNAGAVVNLYSWQRGELLDTTGQPVIITTGKGSSAYQFKTNAGLGFMAATSVYYKLNDKLHVMAEPYFRYNFSPMNNEKLTLKQKYSTVGLRLGIRVDLH